MFLILVFLQPVVFGAGVVLGGRVDLNAVDWRADTGNHEQQQQRLR